MDKELLKQAGMMLPHMALFERMLHMRTLLWLAGHMEERGDRVTLVSAGSVTLVGQEMTTHETVTTSRGEVTAAAAYQVLHELKGHEAAEYAVTREELKALNAGAVDRLASSAELLAFGETLERIVALRDPRKGRAGEEAPFA
ncbi:hypothetical protein [Deinococcus ficus]|uniref:Multidrug DMT transporter n=1 Tax=Deinococcus ficus TaxID=317577 RepID=A0A221T2P5_9DEIO|nr:hypothetical protein [Deinococcus ficus]ASN83172.1 hypothetical protein DFI_18400 [Deinococcus ficus]